MKNIQSAKCAGGILLATLTLLSIFHVLVILGIVPSDIVWGGTIDDSHANLLPLELTALAVNLLFIAITAAKTGCIRTTRFRKTINAGVWFMFAFFVLNTIGNVTSPATVEKVIFTPLTILLSLLSLRLAFEK